MAIRPQEPESNLLAGQGRFARPGQRNTGLAYAEWNIMVSILSM